MPELLPTGHFPVDPVALDRDDLNQTYCDLRNSYKSVMISRGVFRSKADQNRAAMRELESKLRAIAEREALIRERKANAKTAVQREAIGMAIGNAVQNSRQIDVLVTETDAPVFLYLTSYDSVLWNIQRAPGVEIDGIVVNSYNAGAIANGVDAARTGFISFDNSPTRKCYIGGQGRAIPVEERIASAKRLNPDFDPRRYKAQWEQEYRDATRFFRQDVKKLSGKRPQWILNDARGSAFNAVLVGPAPATPFEAQAVNRLQIPSHITPYWGGRKDAYKAFGLSPSS